MIRVLRFANITYADGGLSGAFSSAWWRRQLAIASGSKHVIMGHTFGCRRYFRLPVGVAPLPCSGFCAFWTDFSSVSSSTLPNCVEVNACVAVMPRALAISLCNICQSEPDVSKAGRAEPSPRSRAVQGARAITYSSMSQLEIHDSSKFSRYVSKRDATEQQ